VTVFIPKITLVIQNTPGCSAARSCDLIHSLEELAAEISSSESAKGMMS
jgi:hypothetical protein